MGAEKNFWDRNAGRYDRFMSNPRTSKTLTAEKTERWDGKARPAACVLREIRQN